MGLAWKLCFRVGTGWPSSPGVVGFSDAVNSKQVVVANYLKGATFDGMTLE
ncbi:MAG: hypothetical protein VX768_14045 [Planctomycetota bacterium]|nr:hypothetical protein [Planctomycetota bacterium]